MNGPSNVSSGYYPSPGGGSAYSGNIHRNDPVADSIAYVMRGFTEFVFGFAVLASILIVMVLLKDGFRTTSNISFFALAIADFCTSFMWFCYNAELFPGFPANPVTSFLSRYTQVKEATNTIGAWITVIITWERLCCVALPLKWSKTAAAVVVIAVVVVVVVVIVVE
ncbi:multitransmembrane protein [Elysia marginata]|uniref:Multitransmembrane protein n=1 Tax=Elysia marginata TaxID=1093978 RepID=A0AAV4IIA1_9GAST|nr:multitransmembrane protein [Elysia marginata]